MKKIYFVNKIHQERHTDIVTRAVNRLSKGFIFRPVKTRDYLVKASSVYFWCVNERVAHVKIARTPVGVDL